MTDQPCGVKFTGHTPEGLDAQPLCTLPAGHDGDHRTRGVTTERPKLYPGHRHQWAKLLRRSEAEMVWCVVCGFEVPRSLANLDGAMLNDAVYDEPDVPDTDQEAAT